MIANIDRLKSKGTPEIIYRSMYQLIDRTIYVEIPVSDHSEKLIGYTTGFSYYDGCITFRCTPFNIDALKTGAIFIAQSLDLDLSLLSSDYSEIGILIKPGTVSPQDLISERFSDLATISTIRSVKHDWKSKLEIACISWLNNHPEAQTAEDWRSVLTDGHSLALSLKNRLTSIETIREASIIHFDRTFWHSCFTLKYDDWSGLVNLSGHPQPLFES